MSNRHKLLKLVFPTYLSLWSLARISAVAECTPPSADQVLLTPEVLSEHIRYVEMTDDVVRVGFPMKQTASVDESTSKTMPVRNNPVPDAKSN